MDPKVHYRIQKSPPPIPIQSYTNPVHTPERYFPQIHFDIILSFTPRSSEGLFPWGFPAFIVCAFLIFPSALYAPPTHPWFDHPNNIWWRVQIVELFIMQFHNLQDPKIDYTNWQ
jgi:hypothetical protein